jgi:hypothetical protein
MCLPMRRFCVLCIASAATLAGGCGGSGNPTTSGSVIADAAEKTSNLSTARISETVKGSLNGRSLGEGSGHGVVDGRRRHGTLTYDLSFLANASPGVSGDALKGKIVFFGEREFLTSSVIAKKLPVGKRWLLVTEEQLDKAGGPTGGLSGAGTLDATRPVDHLRAVSGDAEELRDESIDGRPTKHLRAELDYRDYVALLPARERPPLEKGVDKLDATLGSTTFPVEAWIAEDGTIVRTKGTIDGHGLHLEYTLDLTDIGDPVSIRPPASALVLDRREP